MTKKVDPEEPEIVVNGVRLSEGQAMTVRVALTTFHGEMLRPAALGDDEHGRHMSKAYGQRAEEVLTLMLLGKRGSSK